MKVDEVITLLRTYDPNLECELDAKVDGQFVTIHHTYIDVHGAVRISARDRNDDDEDE